MSEAEAVARVPGTIILRTVVGSTLHGLQVDDGLEDRDEMGVCVESLRAAMGMGRPFEQVVYRTAAEREGRSDAKSRAGDLDLVVYGLRRWMLLALRGNPTILTLLFAPLRPEFPAHDLGLQLRELAPAIVSRQAGGAFLGYFTDQRDRLMGLRGQKDVNRPELVGRYGFDTKYAMHLLRLGVQGVELLSTGRITYPMPEPERTRLRGVRTGQVPLPEVLEWAARLEVQLRRLWVTSSLRDWPDVARVDDWVCGAYLRHWKWREEVMHWWGTTS